MKGTGQTSLNSIVGKTINHHYCTITTWSASFFVINSLLFTIDLRSSNVHWRKIIFNIRYILRCHIAIAIWALHILVLHSRCQTIFLTKVLWLNWTLCILAGRFESGHLVFCGRCCWIQDALNLNVMNLDVWYPGLVVKSWPLWIWTFWIWTLRIWMFCGCSIYARRRSQPFLNNLLSQASHSLLVASPLKFSHPFSAHIQPSMSSFLRPVSHPKLAI
jgi:hypothetical protein